MKVKAPKWAFSMLLTFTMVLFFTMANVSIIFADDIQGETGDEKQVEAAESVYESETTDDSVDQMSDDGVTQTQTEMDSNESSEQDDNLVPEDTNEETDVDGESDEEQADSDYSDTDPADEDADSNDMIDGEDNEEESDVEEDGWHDDEASGRYYIENGLRICSEAKRIDGILYGFDEYGYLMSDCEGELYDAEADMFFRYRAKSDGSLYEEEWYQDEYENTFYYGESGALVQNQVKVIDGSLYGFDSGGYMYNDIEFSIYDEETEEWTNYRAKSGGSLYENEWYYNEYGTAWYYGENGVAVNGVQTIDGTSYLFYEGGQLWVDGETTIDGKVYISDENGFATELNNGWNEIEDNWYYVSSGEIVRNQVKKIGSRSYGFDYSGHMYNDTEFSMYDEETEDWINYRAKSGGSLYVNEWYNGENDDFYYGENGVAARGVQTVDGTIYLFYDDGGLWKDGKCTIEDKLYISNEDGVATELKSNGWTKVGNHWYYTESGELIENQVKKIGNKLYGFDYNGQMYDNTEFSIYDEETGEWINYRAKSGGSLYVNEWYDGEYDYDEFYYGENGVPVSGVQTIDGTKYLFYDSGQLWRNGCSTIDGKIFASNEDGVAAELKSNGWTKANNYWYYAESGTLIADQVMIIGNKWYGFNYNGRMYDDADFSIYDSETDDWIRYRARSGGVLYVNEWYTDEDYIVYYYGDGGKAVSGLQAIDGTKYLFYDDGQLWRNANVTIEGKPYVSDNDGIATELKSNGWSKAGGYWYYAESGSLLKDQVKKISNKWYGFDYYGRMYDNNTGFDICDEENEEWISYRAKKGGVLYENAWYHDDGDWNYYGADAKGCDGLTLIDGQYYIFRDGVMMQNASIVADGCSYVSSYDGIAVKINNDGWTKINSIWYYAENGEVKKDQIVSISGSQYGFDYYGRMYCNTDFEITDDYRTYWFRADASGKLMHNRWYQDIYEHKWYYDEDGHGADGVLVIDGKVYLFSDGEMLTNTSEEYEGKIYVADNSGNTIILNTSGWTSVNGNWYYADNGELIRDQIYNIKGTLYAFDWDGVMHNDESFSLWEDEEEDDIYYRARSGGALVVNNWYKDNVGCWWHYGANGRASNGIELIKGKLYAFYYDGEMRTSGAYHYENKIYAAHTNGELAEISKNGWNKVDGRYYYFENNDFLCETVRKIGNYLYAFDSEGVMVDDNAYSIWDENDSDLYYRARSGGTLYTNSWYKDIHGGWWYYDVNGRAVNGKVTIKGVDYLFDYEGNLLSNCAINVDGKSYAADSNGKAVVLNDNGWTRVGSYWYYTYNSNLVSGIYTVKGKAYLFSDGQMVTNQALNIYDAGYASGNDGVAVRLTGNGWQKVGSYWYYVLGNRAVITAVIKDGGSYYLVDDAGRMLSGRTIEMWDEDDYMGYYRAKSSGKLYVNEWYQDEAGDKWYYGDHGEAVSGSVTIDGKTYQFDYDGKLIA